MATPPVIPPLGEVPSAPDKDTKKAFHDFTGKTAPDRVLFLNLGFLKYGTSDKAHAASMALSGALLIMIALVAILGTFPSTSAWADTLLKMLGSAFTFVVGVAIGRGSSHRESADD